jgi:glutamate:Na+ symporter, ESS family
MTLSELHTLAAGLGAFALGAFLARRIRVIERLDIPTPVVGGIVVAAGVAALRGYGGIEILFASQLSNVLLLVFFTTVGLSAKLSSLKAGGRPLVLLCAVTVLMIVAQNAAGVLIALGFGAHPFYGLLAGSISFVGGPGTAAAWATEAQAAGLEGAAVVAVTGATFAVVAGALLAGPLTGWLVRRHGLQSSGPAAQPSWLQSLAAGSVPSLPTVERAMHTLLLIVLGVLIGDAFNTWARSAGLVLPGFLTALLAGVLITNIADPLGMKLDVDGIQRNGQMALEAFLAMYLMTLKLWTIGGAILPLLVNLLVQVSITAMIAYCVLFRVLGRDYDAALTVGGFLGFGLSSMAVGMATMDKIAVRYGPSPRAFLLITLAGSFFVDLANAVVVQLFLLLPIFH